MDDLQAAVGTVVRRERRERGLTLKQLAARAILSVVYLGEIERGKKYPSPVTLERLADALELSTPDLLELIALELRGETLTVAPRGAFGFTHPRAETTTTPTHGRALNLLPTLVA